MNKLMLTIIIVLMSSMSMSWAGTDLDACRSFNSAKDYARAIESGKKAVKSEPRNPAAYYWLGIAYHSSGSFKEALREVKIAEQLATEKKSLMFIYNLLGAILDITGDTEQALQQHHRALMLSREVGDADIEAAELNNIATIYKDQNNLDKALEYYEKAINIWNSDAKKSATYGNIAMIYTAKGDNKKAEEYLKLSIKLDEKSGNYHGLAINLLNLGNVYRKMGLYEISQTTLDLGLDKIKRVKDSYWEAYAYQYIGRLYRDRGNKLEARKAMTLAMELFGRIGASSNAKDVHSELDTLK